MNKRKKILILGLGQSNFLDQLYGEIKKRTIDFEFWIGQYSQLSNDKVGKNYPYDKKIDTSKKFSWLIQLKSLFAFSLTRFFWQIILFEISQKNNFNGIKDLIQELNLSKLLVETEINPLNPDVVQFHFCLPRYLREIYFLKPEIRVICTFWGSDLLRFTGVTNVFYVKKALERASKITVQTPELAEVIYSKYDRKFQSKICILRFNLEIKIFDKIDLYRYDKRAIDAFKKKFNIPSGRIVVAIGHNAFPENNHLRVMEEIRKMPLEITSSYVFVLHLGYGGNKDYIKKLNELIRAENKIKFVIINEFLNPGEIALLRLSTDLFFQVPVSDALSATVTELFYADKIVVAGSWLPYSFFKRCGIQFIEIEDFNEIQNLFLNPSKITSSIGENNREAIIEHFFPHVTSPKWIKLFLEI